MYDIIIYAFQFQNLLFAKHDGCMDEYNKGTNWAQLIADIVEIPLIDLFSWIHWDRWHKQAADARSPLSTWSHLFIIVYSGVSNRSLFS